jgi:hypothetical protein
MSPGWQSSTRQIESSVVSRMARARPFFRTATFAGVMPTALAAGTPQAACRTTAAGGNVPVTRRRPGEGSIYPRKDGRWAGSLHIGYEDGKRVRKHVMGRTRNEVKDKLAVLMRAPE